jgi:hypothetical protein
MSVHRERAAWHRLHVFELVEPHLHGRQIEDRLHGVAVTNHLVLLLQSQRAGEKGCVSGNHLNATQGRFCGDSKRRAKQDREGREDPNDL